MILEKLTLENFRQFYGRQEIVFSGNKERNVTVIHAENGFGKTTLLNAFLWALHGSRFLTSDFEKKDRLINEKLEHDSRDPHSAFAKVELIFSSGDKKVNVTRKISLAQQGLRAEGDLSVRVISALGVISQPANELQEIRSLVPPGIANFLFFNGENIDKYATEGASDSVSAAIRNMMGLELIQRTIDDLEHQNVRGKFVKELSDKASEEKSALIKTREQALEQKKSTCDQIADAQKEISACDEEIRQINAKLEANQSVANMQKQRSELESQASMLKEKIETLTDSLEKLINEDGYSIVGSSLIAPSRQMMNQWRKDGQIPAQVLDTFLKDLLHAERCICQRELGPGSSHRAAVEGLLQIAGDQIFNTAVGTLDQSIGHLDASSERARAKLTEIRTLRAESLIAHKRAREQIEEIAQTLGNQNDNSVRELEDRRGALNISRDDYLVQIGKLKERLPQIEKTIVDLQKEIDELTDDEDAAQAAQSQVKAIDSCIETLKQILAAETAELIPELESEINKHFAQSINQVGYRATIDENFRINVIKASGEVVARNQALRQALSLCFIGSLIELSRRRAEVPSILQGLAGTVYPVVMDSPFGAMDNETRKATARIMPELANQVVAMISSSQYEGGVDEVFKQTCRIGKRYYLRYHNTQFTGERANRSMTIDGRPLQLFKEDSFEHTQIIEIS